MLSHPTHDRLVALGLVGMAKAFEEQRQQPAVASLTFEERLGLLVDREAVERESKRLVTRLKFANLRQNATVEHGSLARSDTKHAATIDRYSTIAYHACSTHLRWHAAMDGMYASSRASPVSSF